MVDPADKAVVKELSVKAFTLMSTTLAPRLTNKSLGNTTGLRFKTERVD